MPWWKPSVDIAIGEASSTTIEAAFAPNPANDHVVISGKSMSDIAVFNSLGQQVLHQTVSGETATIETSGLENGIYLVRINGNIMQRLVIAH